ncbi:hypothetical protein DERP_014288 [Dermatophagoides pteronyssinus]|uniref:Uncharacterized protein n=1 Tax=Dermatophagoides pteronyssinus TaxID=6956 RepID=A0ABQ8IXG7_DERPT|nr:hypothetical protein DERP_014288 [Dermatophagoides pteronyssinus]
MHITFGIDIARREFAVCPISESINNDDCNFFGRQNGDNFILAVLQSEWKCISKKMLKMETMVYKQ